MFNIKTNYCRNHNKIMCELEWVKDEDADVRQHLFTFDPYWLSGLDNAIRAAYDDVNHMTLQLMENTKPSNIEKDGYYVFSLYGEKGIAVRRTFDDGNDSHIMWRSLNHDNDSWMTASSVDDWVILNKLDLDNESVPLVREV